MIPTLPTPDQAGRIADQVTRVDYDRQYDKDPGHIQRVIETIRALNYSIHYDAVVTKLSDEHVDEFIVDVYAGGFGSTVSFTEVKAYPAIPGQNYTIDNRVKVRYLPNDTVLILPLEVPLDTGFGKVLQIVDSGNPGTVMFDYVRLTKPISTVT